VFLDIAVLAAEVVAGISVAQEEMAVTADSPEVAEVEEAVAPLLVVPEEKVPQVL